MDELKKELGQLFENNSNCYAEMDVDDTVMAMDKDQFVKIVVEYLNKRALAENTPTSKKQLATPAVSKSVEPVRKPTVCVHPIPQRTYVGHGWLKCGVCGEEFQ